MVFSEVGRPIALQLRILELSLGTEDKAELGANQLVIVERLIRQGLPIFILLSLPHYVCNTIFHFFVQTSML